MDFWPYIVPLTEFEIEEEEELAVKISKKSEVIFQWSSSFHSDSTKKVSCDTLLIIQGKPANSFLAKTHVNKDDPPQIVGLIMLPEIKLNKPNDVASKIYKVKNTNKLIMYISEIPEIRISNFVGEVFKRIAPAEVCILSSIVFPINFPSDADPMLKSVVVGDVQTKINPLETTYFSGVSASVITSCKIHNIKAKLFIAMFSASDLRVGSDEYFYNVYKKTAEEVKFYIN